MWNERGFRIPFDRSDWPPVVQTGGECDRRPYTEEQVKEATAKVDQAGIGECPICVFDDGTPVWHLWWFIFSG